MSGEPPTGISPGGHSPGPLPRASPAPLRRDSEGTRRWAPRVARWTTIWILCGYGTVAAVNFVRLDVSWTHILGFIALFAVVFALQLLHSLGGALHWPWRRKALTLTGQAIATYLPLLWIGTVWGGMAGFLAGSVLLIAQSRIRWAIYTVVGLSVLVPALLLSMSIPDTTYYVISTLLTGLVIYAISSLSALVLEVNRTRAEVARMAVFQERLRVARDLHDLIGYSLSSVTLKSELSYRLLPENPQRARQQVAETLDIARQALADVRKVASGYREMSLATELRSARSVLKAADINVQADITCDPIPQPMNTVLAAVLREAITNVLRHSKAQRCVIRVTRQAGSVWLEVSNDGVDAVRSASRFGDGSGLGNLAARLEVIDGRLATDVRDGAWFRLVAQAPAPPETSQHATDA